MKFLERSIRFTIEVLLVGAGILLAPAGLQAQSMDDATAMTKAKGIWGTNATIGRFRAFGDPNWTYKVGCIDAYTRSVPTWVGTSKISWDDAFAHLMPQTCVPLNTTAPSAYSEVVPGIFVYLDQNQYTASFNSCMAATNPSAMMCSITAHQVMVAEAWTRFYNAFIAMNIQMGANASPILTQYNVLLGTVNASAPPAAFAAVFLGATGQDLVGQLQASPAPDGVPDWHIQLQGLKSTPVQVQITANPVANGEWDAPYDGSHWIIGPQYALPNGDLFFDPFLPAGVTIPSVFHVKVTYMDSTIDQADTTTTLTH